MARSVLFTRGFWEATGERAAKTAAQAALALLTADKALSIVDVDFERGAGIVALATLVSVLMSIASAGLTGGGPSITNAERVQ